MPRRNIILLIIILALAALAFFGFLYWNRSPGEGPAGEDGGADFFAKWNPFASRPGTPGSKPPEELPGEEEIPPQNLDLKLMRVSSMPVAGFGVFQKERLKEDKSEFAPAVRYVERARGFIYQTFADRIKEEKFSGTVISRVYEAFFGNNAESVVMRYLKSDDETIETFVGILPEEFAGEPAKDDYEIKGSFLPENTTDVSISGDSKKMFYLFNLGDGAVGTVLDFAGNKKTQVLETPFTEWLSSWPNNQMITLNTKPASGIDGYLYKLDLGNKSLSKILGGIGGLTSLPSASGNLVLYADDTLNLYLYNLGTREIKSLGIRTLPEKCAWSKEEDHLYCAAPQNPPPAAYPDGWYRGEVSFTDEIWEIDVSSAVKKLVVNPALEIRGEEMDAVKLALDEKESYLFFINKKTSYLWRWDLK